MSTIKEVLRLKYLGKQSHRNIELLGLASKSAVSGYITRFEKSKLGIYEALDMEESRLEALLFPEHVPRLKPYARRRRVQVKTGVGVHVGSGAGVQVWPARTLFVLFAPTAPLHPLKPLFPSNAAGLLWPHKNSLAHPCTPRSP